MPMPWYSPGETKAAIRQLKQILYRLRLYLNLVLVKAAELSATRLSSFLVPVEAIAAPFRDAVY